MEITEWMLSNIENLFIAGFPILGLLLVVFNVHHTSMKLSISLLLIAGIAVITLIISDVPTELRDNLIIAPEYISTESYEIEVVAKNRTEPRDSLDIYIGGGIVVVSEGKWMPVEGDSIKFVHFTSEHGFHKVWRVCLSKNLYLCANVRSKPEHLGLPKEKVSIADENQ